MPRSTALISDAPGAVADFSYNGQSTAIPVLAANASATISLPLPRRFRPKRQILVNTFGVLPAGVTLDSWQVLGNSPTSGATPAGYTLSLIFQNNMSTASVAGSTQLRVIQL